MAAEIAGAEIDPRRAIRLEIDPTDISPVRQSPEASLLVVVDAEISRAFVLIVNAVDRLAVPQVDPTNIRAENEPGTDELADLGPVRRRRAPSCPAGSRPKRACSGLIFDSASTATVTSKATRTRTGVLPGSVICRRRHARTQSSSTVGDLKRGFVLEDRSQRLRSDDEILIVLFAAVFEDDIPGDILVMPRSFEVTLFSLMQLSVPVAWMPEASRALKLP